MRCGLSFSNTSPRENILQKRKRCSLCPHTKDKTVAKCCSQCSRPVCQSTASPPSYAMNAMNERRIENCKLCSYLSRTFFSFYLLFCSFVSFKFLRIKYPKHFRHATIEQLSNNKERKRKICKEIVFGVKITCKSNRGQNDPCYALT